MALDIGDFQLESQFYAIVVLVMVFTSCIISTYIGMLTIKYLLFSKFSKSNNTKNPNKKQIHGFLRYGSLASILGFCTCNILQFTALILYVLGMDFLVPWFTGDSYIWCIGKYIMYPLFMGRLYITFRGTRYQYKWYNIGFILCISLLIIQFIGNIQWNYYYSIGNTQMILISSIVIYATDPVYCIFITIMFISKLNQIKNGITVDGFSSSRKNLINLMTKQALLSFIGISSSIFAVIIACIRWYYIDATWMWCSALSVSIDCSVSVICILFQFAFAKSHYFRYFGGCDNCIKAVFVNKENLHNLTLSNMQKTSNTQSTKKCSDNHSNDDKDNQKHNHLNIQISPPSLSPKDSNTYINVYSSSRISTATHTVSPSQISTNSVSPNSISPPMGILMPQSSMEYEQSTLSSISPTMPENSKSTNNTQQ